MKDVLDKKLLKRCVFLRKLLERYDIRWELKFIEKRKFVTKYSYEPFFKNDYLDDGKYKICLNFDDILIEYNENEHDLRTGLTTATFGRFKHFAESRNKAEYLEVKRILDNVIAIDNKKQSFLYQIETIDFERTIQNMILDGISLDGLPDIEEVI